MSFVTLIRREPRALAFGFIHTFAATIGQTFVIALFLPGVKSSFGLSDAEISLLFTATTLASAAVLWKIGGWIDRSDIARYALWCGLFLALSCAAVAASREIVLLAAGFFCLRLSGNGLLTHVALTATARYFTRERGRALSFVLLGSSVGEAGFPALIVSLNRMWGWRLTLVAAGALGLALVAAAAAVVWKRRAFRTLTPEDTPLHEIHGRSAAESRRPATRRYFILMTPLLVAMPLVVTATVFHQSSIAQAKSVSLQWFAVSFVAFAIARVATSIFTGRLVDRFGSGRLLCAHLAPLAAGTVALIVADSRWVVPLFWLCGGIASGMGGVLQTTIVAERVMPSQLGRARSRVTAATIVASAAGPSLFGAALAAGADIAVILWGSVLVLAAATAAGVAATRSDAAPAP